MEYNRSICLFEQDIENDTDIRLSLINKTLSKYRELNNIPMETMKAGLKRIESDNSQSFYYKDDLIISVKNGFSFNGLSYEINYFLNELLETA